MISIVDVGVAEAHTPFDGNQERKRRRDDEDEEEEEESPDNEEEEDFDDEITDDEDERMRKYHNMIVEEFVKAAKPPEYEFEDVELARQIVLQQNRPCHKDYVCPYLQHRRFFFGTPMLDIFSVRIQTKNPGSGRLYGVVKIESGQVDEYLYKVRKDCAEFVKFDQNDSSYSLNILPAGPTHALTRAVGQIYIIIALRYDDVSVFQGDVFECVRLYKDSEIFGIDNPACQAGVVTWDGRFEYNELLHEKPRHQEKMSNNFSVFVDYVVFKYGVEASMLVKVKNCDVERVYGLITARCCTYDKETCTYVLFSKERNEAVEVDSKEKRVTLPKPLVAVSCEASLIIEAELYDQNDNLIVNGSEFFHSVPFGYDEKPISTIGRGEIVVGVQWN